MQTVAAAEASPTSNSPSPACRTVRAGAPALGARWLFFLLGFFSPRGSDGRGAHQVLTHSTVRNLTDVCRRASRTRCSWALFSIAGVIHKAETRIRIRLSIRVRIPELLQARTYAIPYVKEPAGQRDVYGQSGCCPVRFRNTCMFGIAHAGRFQHE